MSRGKNVMIKFNDNLREIKKSTNPSYKTQTSKREDGMPLGTPINTNSPKIGRKNCDQREQFLATFC